MTTRKSNFIQYGLGVVLVGGLLMYYKDKISAEHKDEKKDSNYFQLFNTQ